MNHLGQTEYNTISHIDTDIVKYQKNIAGLNKIMRIGSDAGKRMAARKLTDANKNLEVLLQKRKRLSKESGLEGFGSISKSILKVILSLNIFYSLSCFILHL